MSTPSLEPVHTLAKVAPTPDLIEDAAHAVVESWHERDDDTAESAETYREIFEAIAALPPLTACALGVEIRRRFRVFVPKEQILACEVRWSEVMELRRSLEERFFRALVMRATDVAGEE